MKLDNFLPKNWSLKTATKGNTEEALLNDLPDNSVVSEAEQQAHIKLLRQTGFQLASRNGVDVYVLLDEEIRLLGESTSRSVQTWYAYYETLLQRLREKRRNLQEEILEIQSRKLKHDADIAEQKERKAQFKTEIEALKKELVSIRKAIAASKKGIGERLVAEADTEIENAVKLQKKIYEDTKTINTARFTDVKHALDENIRKWQIIRERLADDLQTLNIKIKALNDYGISPSVAYTLVSLGSAMAGVAGFFFAIFSYKSNYSSNDVFYYLLKNIITAVTNNLVPFYVKALYFVGALGLVTIVSWSIDLFLRKLNHFQKDKEDRSQHFFSTNFNIEGFKYSFRTKGKRWLFVWLKVVPLLLIIGAIILLLSCSNDIQTQTTQLSASTEGLLIGTAIAMGLAAVVYIYLTKVTEARAAASNWSEHIKRNWELVTGILVFVASMSIFAFYKSEGFAGTYSIIGFLGTCLLTAFSFSYGLRFCGFYALLREKEQQIRAIDRVIAYNSVPDQEILDINLQDYFKQLGKGLLDNLIRKNEVMSKSSKDLRVRALIEQPDKTKRILDIPFPNEKRHNLEDAALFDIMEWELKYFPEHAEDLKVLASLYRSKMNELAETETALKNCISKRESQMLPDKTELAQANAELDRIYTMMQRVEEKRLKKLDLLKDAFRIDTCYLKDGFALGLWYRDNGMGLAQQQLLLT